MNAEFAAVAGRDPAEATGKTGVEIGLWKDPKAYRQLHSALDARHGVRNLEIEVGTRDGG